MFGWATPVPVDPSHFRAPRQMMALVALAGPMMNITLAFLAAHVFRLPHIAPELAAAVGIFIDLNLALAIFNLFPLPPLDGGRIAVGLLPLRLAKLWAGLEPYGIVFVLLLIAVPPVLRTQGIDIDPLGSVLGPAMVRLQDGIFWLAGVPNGAV
jgi:Zn-dependent protease